MGDKRSISGSCSCGNISWTSTASPQHLDFCYCLTCQKVSGAPFQAWTGIPKASLTWNFFRSQPFIYRSLVGDKDISVGERTCCGNCGCNISLQYYLYPEKIHVAASTIDVNTLEPIKVGCHIWTKRAPSWYSIPDDGVPRYQEFDEDFQAKLDHWMASQGSRSKELQAKGGWWAGLMPGSAPDYGSINGADALTMNDLWEDPQLLKRPA